MSKKQKRKCIKCGLVSTEPGAFLYRFPKPGVSNALRCELWAKYCFPKSPWHSQKFQGALYSEHRMLCHKHFKPTSFIDFEQKKLHRHAAPDEECDSIVMDNIAQSLPAPVPLDLLMLSLPQDNTVDKTTQTDKSNHVLPEVPKMEKESYKLLIAATGSVAALKLPSLVKAVLDSSTKDFEVRGIVTDHAKHFFSERELPPTVKIYDDKSEWAAWSKRGDPVLHIELGKWADMMVIAPLDANTLAKMSQGICDNLLTCTTRAWNMSKPLLFCPAMNTRMWEHPITSKQVSLLESWGHEQIPPISKTLMCGDTGVGAMAEVDTIVQTIHKVRQRSVTKDSSF